MSDRFPHALSVTLEQNYRSSRQVLALASRLAPSLGGAAKSLIATRPDGPDPVIRPWLDRDDEARGLVAWIESLVTEGVPLEGIAVLSRTNARSEGYEEALSRTVAALSSGFEAGQTGHAAGIPAYRRFSSGVLVGANSLRVPTLFSRGTLYLQGCPVCPASSTLGLGVSLEDRF